MIKFDATKHRKIEAGEILKKGDLGLTPDQGFNPTIEDATFEPIVDREIGYMVHDFHPFVVPTFIRPL